MNQEEHLLDEAVRLVYSPSTSEAVRREVQGVLNQAHLAKLLSSYSQSS